MLTAWDTTVVSQLHPTGRYRALYAAREAIDAAFVLTAPTVLEAKYGISRLAPTTRVEARDWYERFFDGPLARVLPVDRAAAGLAGELRARHPLTPSRGRRDPRSRGDRRVAWVLDVLIAATAWTSGYGVTTHNRRDFELLRDLISELHPDLGPLAVEDPPTS